MNKRYPIAVIMFLCVLFIFGWQVAFGEEGYLGYEGGISAYKDPDPKKTKIEYYEYTFITGKPILLSGTIDAKIKRAANNETLSYNYDLKDSTGKISVKRTVSLKGTLTKLQNGSITKEYTISTYKETLTVDSTTYNLQNYSFSKSTAVDTNPAVSFFQGQWTLEKTYDKGLKITIEGKNYGYDGYWGSGEFQNIKQTVETPSWFATINYNIATVQKTILEFQQNNLPSSIPGTYVLKSKVEGNFTAMYDLPTFTKTGEVLTIRQKGKVTKSIAKSPIVRMAIAPTLPKVKGYEYEDAVNTCFAFGGFDSATDFNPTEYITRAQFAKLLMDTLNIYSNYYNPRTVQKKSIYKDVPLNHKYYGYIYAVTKAGLMRGKSAEYFKPEDYITRAEAAVVISKVLGFDKKVTQPITQTDYLDDDSIPVWAKDAVKVLKDEKIMVGTEDNNFLPQQRLTKGTAANLVYNLINFLRDTLARRYLDMSLFSSD
ncbi:S-layer domain protein [Caldicellulosiruptor hydrothermalis 108]|uniref:S-layer domain protein n=1 Tax=Caldicellulosiruptor hydrothermalis (strain DSM 18901 / VKM B-2411 / 108) TaxID=632292 RepID=E4QAL8_CALH1|nr:S-layer homology domain-containing protein [Caldicellulosiruptor hydrothermalis]ADQ05943.1 S-layer domain protein [Caldicellulosiruptor hydrothermalis 108]